MVQILGNTDGRVIAAKATRSVTENDHHKLLPLIINKSKHFSVIRLYLEVAAYEGQNPGIFCDHLKFDGSHIATMDRIALVGDIPCKQLLPKFIELFSSTEVRFFLSCQKEEALAWVNGKDTAAERSFEAKNPLKKSIAL